MEGNKPESNNEQNSIAPKNSNSSPEVTTLREHTNQKSESQLDDSAQNATDRPLTQKDIEVRNFIHRLISIARELRAYRFKEKEKYDALMCKTFRALLSETIITMQEYPEFILDMKQYLKRRYNLPTLKIPDRFFDILILMKSIDPSHYGQLDPHPFRVTLETNKNSWRIFMTFDTKDGTPTGEITKIHFINNSPEKDKEIEEKI